MAATPVLLRDRKKGSQTYTTRKSLTTGVSSAPGVCVDVRYDQATPME